MAYRVRVERTDVAREKGDFYGPARYVGRFVDITTVPDQAKQYATYDDACDAIDALPAFQRMTAVVIPVRVEGR